MKRAALGLLLGMVSVCAVFAAQTEVSKVTYFPVSYAGYHSVNARNLEVGVGRNEATGKIGHSGLAVEPLQVTGNTTVHSSGTITLNDASLVYVDGANAAVVGLDGAGTGPKIDFETNLRFKGKAKFANLNTNNVTATTLNWKGKNFPKCTASRDANGNNMYWVKLKLGAADSCSWYLSCGPVPANAQCTNDGANTKSCIEWYNVNGMRCSSGGELNPVSMNWQTTQGQFDTVCCQYFEWAEQSRSYSNWSDCTGIPGRPSNSCTLTNYGAYTSGGTVYLPSTLPVGDVLPVCNTTNAYQNYTCYMVNDRHSHLGNYAYECVVYKCQIQ